ncbi:MAG: hypothetical protein H6739_15870 [Alphaproteobacteria bacterium]|nr:hypothetical protein [Alphaproteobacteria bacterium]
MRLLLIGGALTLPACGGGRRLVTEVRASADANENSAVPVALVVTNESELSRRLGEMSAEQWFAFREQIQRDYPDEKTLFVAYWELVPGQEALIVEHRVPRARYAWVFADYEAQGEHRSAVPLRPALRVELNQTGFEADPLSRRGRRELERARAQGRDDKEDRR